MALGRGRYVNDVEPERGEHLVHVGERGINIEPITHLLGHQGLAVAHADDFGSMDSLDLGRVLVGHLATTHYPNLDHRRPIASRASTNSRSIPSRIGTLGCQPKRSLAFLF